MLFLFYKDIHFHQSLGRPPLLRSMLYFSYKKEVMYQISMFNNFCQFPTYPAVSSYRQIAGQSWQLSIGNYYQSFQPQTQNIGQQTNITFVNGIECTKAYKLSQNSSALLMDLDNSKFYVKTTDSLGVSNVSSYSFVEDENFTVQNQ